MGGGGGVEEGAASFPCLFSGNEVEERRNGCNNQQTCSLLRPRFEISHVPFMSPKQRSNFNHQILLHKYHRPSSSSSICNGF